ILDTAAAMLEEMPVSELSLNELSRRVGLAKSNVLRYFDSREAVLLELLDSQAAVLEHNVSSEAIVSFKRRGVGHATTLVGLIGQALPELSEEQAWRLVVSVLLLTSSLWAHARPTQALLDRSEE